MAERANAKDEARRAQSLRMAEFFAAWGSTPGSTIAAGLTALKSKLPDIITDSREEARIRRAINKDIAGLDKADRLEKAGAWDAAAKLKSDLAKNGRQTYGDELNFLSARMSDASKERVASVRSEGGGGGTEKRYIDAVKNLEKVETDIATERNKDEYSRLKRTADRDPSGKSATMQKSIADAKAAITKINEGFENRRKLAKDTVARYSGEVGLTTEGTKSDTSTSGAGKVIQYDAKGNRI
jgi:soluble cytochrome b562